MNPNAVEQNNSLNTYHIRWPKSECITFVVDMELVKIQLVWVILL